MPSTTSSVFRDLIDDAAVFPPGNATLPDAVARHRAILTSVGLPTTYEAGHWDALATAMQRDKKTRGSLLRFIVLEDIGAPTRLVGPDEALLRAAYDDLCR